MPETKRPYYRSMTTVVELASGEYGSGPDLDVCSLCGAVVGGTTTHDEWHEKGSSDA